LRVKSKGVAPVLATLLMIAVAVSMSVIIFMWSQGFLSNTSSAVGGQQGAQNIAAQSSITIEVVTFDLTTSTNCTIYVRNIGAVSVELGVAMASGISGNEGFTGSTKGIIADAALHKGEGTAITFGLPSLTAGDTVNFKVTTTVGTFAQAQATVP